MVKLPKIDFWYYAFHALRDVQITKDRYNGTYSHGRWVAIRDYEKHEEAWLDGAQAGDGEAMGFWSEPPSWIGSGDEPNDAWRALCEKSHL